MISMIARVPGCVGPRAARTDPGASLPPKPERDINRGVFSRDRRSGFAFRRGRLISGQAGDRMKPLFALVFLSFVAAPVAAQDNASDADVPMIVSADEIDPADLLWIKRPLVVFADTPADPRYVEQMGYITERLDALAERDVVVITDTDPSARSDVRQRLRPRGFALVLIGKDGEIYLRKTAPWHVREIVRSIDKLPARQREVRESKAAGGS